MYRRPKSHCNINSSHPSTTKPHWAITDTTNRQPETDPDTDPGHGRHGIVPKASNVPPSAMYSGLMECPCTDKL